MSPSIEELIDETNEEEVWEAQVGESFPGEVIETYRDTVFIGFNFGIFDSNGKEHRKAVAKGVDSDYDEGEYVLFSLLSDPPNEDKNPEGRIVERLDAEEYHESVVSHKNEDIEGLIHDLKVKIESVEDEVDSRVEERVEEAKKKLEKRRESLKIKEENLEDKIRSETEKYFQEWSSELDEREEYLQKRKEKLDRRESKLADVEEKLQRFEEEGGPEFMQILRSSTEEEQQESRTPPENEPPPSGFWRTLLDKLEESGYKIHHDLLPLQFVLSATVAAATGQFVVLSGPTGVGKTSLVKKMRKGLGAGPDPDSGKSGIIPVRPSWIDSTDLLGFYNSTEDMYEPKPFMDDLVEARDYGEVGEHYFLVLDEMNLSRIENYGADFLAKMEKAREMGGEEDAEATLHLYSKSIADRKRRRIKSIIDNGEEEQKEEELAELRTRYPARLPIPDGLVLFGTINADETTHPFSPKFKDRAFVIQLPPATLSKDLSSNHENESMEKVWTLTQEFVGDIDPEGDFPDKVREIWKDIAHWNSTHLQPMGIHLSHRLEHLFRYYFAAAQAFGITPDKEDNFDTENSTPYSLENVASTFDLSKILPWVSFHRDDKAISEEDEYEYKRDVLEGWAEDLKEREEDGDRMHYSALLEAIEDALSTGNLTYEYMGR